MNTDKKQNIPKRRFKQFLTYPAWEQRKFKDNIVSIQTGTNLLGSETSFGVPLLKMGNIQRGYFSFNKLEYLDEKQDVEKENIAQYGDFLFNTRNTLELVGKGATWTGKSGEYAFNSNIARFTFDGINTIFFNYLYNTQQMIEQIQARAVGSTSVAAVYPRDLDSVEYYLPSIEEQKQIGSFFLQLDNLITLHQCKCEKLLDLKNSMIYKLFPKEGEKKPEIRFQGFTDEWSNMKLGICFSERTESFPEGELLSVTINDGIKKFSELNRNNNSNEDKSKYKKVYKGDIAYNSMRMWQGASGYSPYEGIVSPAYTVLSPNEGIDSKCFSYLFKRPDIIHMFQLYSKGITSDNWNLKYPEFKELEIYVSEDYEEQKLIGEYLSKLDSIIELNREKLEKLKNIKSFLLDKMFV